MAGGPAGRATSGADLRDLYDRLFARFGPRFWWPGETPFEVCVGAVLTQNTAWRNVEHAIKALKGASILSPSAMMSVEPAALAALIRPAGYYNLKSRWLRSVARFLLDEGGEDLSGFSQWPTERLRAALLDLYGVGPETADSMLLYAFDRAVFVIDAYTRRIFSRLGMTAPEADYPDLQRFFMSRLPLDLSLYNDYHAQLVALGHYFCRPRPICTDCPLRSICNFSKSFKISEVKPHRKPRGDSDESRSDTPLDKKRHRVSPQ